MKLFVLVAPLVALGLLVLLERVEAWCVRAPKATGRTRHPAEARVPPPPRSTMSDPTPPPSARVPDPVVSELPLRDPPAPPGYVDPFEGHASLENLVGADRPPKGSSAGSRPDTT